MDNIIELKEVSYLYGKGTPFERVALDKIDLGFERGKITGLIGHTGSGKSTLVNLLNGLLKPTEGCVYLNGQDIWAEPKKIGAVRFKVGLVMQYPEYQLFDETVYKDIGFGPRNQGLGEAEIKERVDEAIHFAGITSDILEKSPFELSGGQKRRVAIAGVIAMRPEVLVLDEPAAGLDPRGRRDILGGLREIVNARGTTIILVSHSMEDMATHCDNVAVLSKARLFKQGTVEEIFSSADEIASVGLNVPAVSRIASALISRGIDLRGRLYTVNGVRDAVVEYMGRVKK